MKPPRVVHFDHVVPQRWRNGGGWTRELLADPPGEAWRVRISVADVEQDGAFSSFPGVQRHFAVLAGAGVMLTIDGQRHRVVRGGAPVAFAGDATTTCRRIDGPTRDLNLMVRGQGGSLQAVTPGIPWTCASAACGLFATGAGDCRYGNDSDNATLALTPLSLAWFDRAPAALSFDACGWWLCA